MLNEPASVVPQIRKALIGENARLRVIQDSANLLGYEL